MRKSLSFFTLRAIALFVCTYSNMDHAKAQAITEIITSYHNYWKSSATSINALHPDTSHTLLAFTFNGSRYSTGVDDALLTSNGDAFTAQDFRALPVQSLTGTIDGNTKLALAALYDGVNNGPSVPAPVNNIPFYLSDGRKGLNLGTGIANLPVGILSFAVTGFNPPAIGDGIPDIMVTQIADPSTSADDYEFVNSGGTTVGNIVSVTFNGLAPVGNWTADFYEASTNPATLQAAFTQTSRPLRLWASDLSAFGITAANAGTITGFRIHLKGPSDIAFVSFNNATFHTLPISLSFFNVVLSGKDARLLWQTETETGSKYFVVETNTGGPVFTSLDTIMAAGNSSTIKNYTSLQRSLTPGTHYYRLKEIDENDRFSYSDVAQVTVLLPGEQLAVFPNPAKGSIRVSHPGAKTGQKITLHSMNGAQLLEQNVLPGATQTMVTLPGLAPGIYLLSFFNPGGEKIMTKIIVQ